jgi:hypothetical protein
MTEFLQLTEEQLDALDGKRIEWNGGSFEAATALAQEAPKRRGRQRGSKNLARRDASGPGKGPAWRLPIIRKAHRTLRACHRALSDPRYVTNTVEVSEQVAKDFRLRVQELYAAFMRWDDRMYRRELAESGGGR